MNFVKSLFSAAMSGDLVSIAILVLFVLFVISLIKAAKRIAILFLVVAVVMVFFFDYSPKQVVDKGKQVVTMATDTFKSTIEPVLEKELKDATYEMKKDGSYVMTTKSLKITGEKESTDVFITYKDKTVKVNLKEFSNTIQDTFKKVQEQQQQ